MYSIALLDVNTEKEAIKQELKGFISSVDITIPNAHIIYLSIKMEEHTNLALSDPSHFVKNAITIYAINKLQGLPIDPRIKEQVTLTI